MIIDPISFFVVGGLFIGIIVGLYYLFDWLLRKWLGFETYDLPFPAVVRWTMFFGSVSTFFLILWAGVTFLGHRLAL